MNSSGKYKGTVQEKGFVYAMFNNRNRYTKIGFSSKFPVYRERTLQAEDPDIELVAFCKGTRKDESWWHNLFSNYWLRGEWFALDWEDYIDLVTTLDQGLESVTPEH